jgi:hypothetical protein
MKDDDDDDPSVQDEVDELIPAVSRNHATSR